MLIGQLAAATERIRVGAAAVQLGYTTAVAVVESFGMLDALHPGRIDLGVGRSGQRRREADQKPASPRRRKPPRTRHEVDGVVVPAPFDVSALMRNPRLRARMTALQQPEANAPDFADQVSDILAMLDGTFAVEGVETHVTPGEREMRCGRGCSAAARGRARRWPAPSGCHSSRATTSPRPRRWRRSRPIATPSCRRARCPSRTSSCPPTSWWPTTATRREHLASTYGHWVYSIRAGDGAVPYPDPDTSSPLTAEQAELVEDRTATQFVGDPDEVAHRLAALQRVTDADELVVTSVTHRHADRLRSHELIAKRWGI